MKTSSIIFNLIRAAFVLLAYGKMAQPKGTLIPPGTGRTTAYYIKSSYHILKSYLKTVLRHLKMT